MVRIEDTQRLQKVEPSRPHFVQIEFVSSRYIGRKKFSQNNSKNGSHPQGDQEGDGELHGIEAVPQRAWEIRSFLQTHGALKYESGYILAKIDLKVKKSK